MAKFFGVVGYSETRETSPGVWTEVVTEHLYSGDVTRNVRRTENSKNVNDNVSVSNLIEIVADAYAFQHILALRYVNWMGVNWEISNVDVKRPRLILTIGGVYNGQKN